MVTPAVPGAINVAAPLTGQEIVEIATAGPQKAQTTTAAIALLATTLTNDAPTNLTTTVGATIPAASFLTGLLVRSGPTAAFTDTTDTAAALATAVGSGTYPVSFYTDIRNTTAFAQTIAGGTGVTISGGTVVPPNSTSEYLVVLTSASVATFYPVLVGPTTLPPIFTITTLSTVGSGTITAAGIAGANTNRTGATSAFTDTTDTATAIIAAMPNAAIGQSFRYLYSNNTVAVATLTGGVGVTVSGITAVPPGSTAEFLVTYTAASTITMVGGASGLILANSGTFTANGASAVTVSNTAVTATSQILITLKTVGGTVGAMPAVKTITAGTGFTVAGTASDTSVYNYLILT